MEKAFFSKYHSSKNISSAELFIPKKQNSELWPSSEQLMVNCCVRRLSDFFVSLSESLPVEAKLPWSKQAHELEEHYTATENPT